RRGVGHLVVERRGDHALTPASADVPDSFSAASSTAPTMLWYPVQRQKLPSSPARTSCSVGCGFSASRLVATITMPGVQKPHCKPWFSRNACCTTPREPSSLTTPSAVVTARPLAWTARPVQDLTD